MHTTYSPTIHAWPPDVSTIWGPVQWGLQGNKFELVSILGHQMLLVGGWVLYRGPVQKGGSSPVWGAVQREAGSLYRLGGGELYSEIQCIQGNIYMGSSLLWTEWRADTTENITFPQQYSLKYTRP